MIDLKILLVSNFSSQICFECALSKLESILSNTTCYHSVFKEYL